jgi:hypothetical protein
MCRLIEEGKRNPGQWADSEHPTTPFFFS